MSDSNRSSAVPMRLFVYNKQTEAMQTELAKHAPALGTAIANFQASCTEYYVNLDDLVWDLNTFITHDNSLSRWTGAVGVAFLLADMGLDIPPPATPDELNPPSMHVETIEVDERTELLNLIEWAKSLLEDGDLSDEQREDLEEKIEAAQNALAAKAEDTGNDQYAAAGVMVAGAGVLLADDVTVVGVADDVVIPFILVGAGVVALWGLLSQSGSSPDEMIQDAISQMNSESSDEGQSEESKDFLGKNDPNSWAGKDPQDVEDAIPDDWVKSPANKGGGTKYSNPGRPGEQIIIEPGWPNATDPTHAGPYVKVSSGGKVIRIPLKGNPALGGP